MRRPSHAVLQLVLVDQDTGKEWVAAVNGEDFPIFIPHRQLDPFESLFRPGAVAMRAQEMEYATRDREVRKHLIYRAAEKLADHLIEQLEVAEGIHVSGTAGDPSVEPKLYGTRAEHLAACKLRAREYIDRGKLHDAVSSMLSDLGKHDQTASLASVMGMIGLVEAASGSAEAVSQWVERFN